MRIHDVLSYQSRENADAIFAKQADRQLTYQEAQAQVNRIANALLDSGLTAGDRVAIVSKNSIEYVLLYLASSKTGIVLVPLNYRLSPKEWVYIINDSNSKMFFASKEYLAPINEIRAEIPQVANLIAMDSEMEGWKTFQNWAAQYPSTAPDVYISPTQVLYQMYTSGTTGHPKGAMLTQNAVASNIVQSSMVLKGDSNDKILVVAPLYHCAAAFTAFNTMFVGGSMCIQEDFHPMETARILSEEHITKALLVPAMIQACLAMPNVATRDYSNLKHIIYGASPISRTTLQRAIEVFKCEFSQAYGMTETSALLTWLSANDHKRAVADQPELLLSAGRSVPGTEIRIVDEDDNPVPNGTSGEITARGPQLMQGYWGNDKDSADALRGGWMHTGDVGVIDDHGYLYIKDRVKDVIISGGENIYPRIIEDVLAQHPAIAEAAAIGIPDEKWGETVKVFAVLKPSTEATEQEIIDFCHDKLGGFERPRSVSFIPVLPRNASGKVLKRVLRAPFWANRDRQVSGS